MVCRPKQGGIRCAMIPWRNLLIGLFLIKNNGYQHQAGADYRERYALFVMGTVPETMAPDKKSVVFLEIFGILPEDFITLPRFCVNLADISLP